MEMKSVYDGMLPMESFLFHMHPDDHHPNISDDFNESHVTLQVRHEVIQIWGARERQRERAICVVFYLSSMLKS